MPDNCLNAGFYLIPKYYYNPSIRYCNPPLTYGCIYKYTIIGREASYRVVKCGIVQYA